MISAHDTEPHNLLHPWLERHADIPEAEFVLEARGSRGVRYGELATSLARCRELLASWDLRSGDRVGLLIADPLEFVSWFLAGLHAGLWVAPLDPNTRATRATVLGHRARSLQLVALVGDTPLEATVATPWHDATSVPAGDAVLAREEVGGGVLLASSGTTGAPKVMALSKGQLLANARLIADHHEFLRSDRGLNSLPLWHINAEVVGVLASLYAGSSLVLDDRFHRTGFWKVVNDREVTWINAVPAIISRLVTLQEGESIPERVRFVRSASAPLSPTLLRDFERMSGVPVIESYGMTEAASQICANPHGAARKPGSVGRPVGVEVRVRNVHEASGVLAAGEVGPIEIKGPTVIGAYESPSYADRFDERGWLRTGDLGYFDGDGYLYLVGRSDDVINRGGEKIYPQEIENVLNSIASLKRVVVIGEPDDVFGQVPVAYLEFAPMLARHDQRLDAALASVRSILRDGLSRTSRPALLKVVEEIPTHPTGKVRKGMVRNGEVHVLRVERL